MKIVIKTEYFRVSKDAFMPNLLNVDQSGLFCTSVFLMCERSTWTHTLNNATAVQRETGLMLLSGVLSFVGKMAEGTNRKTHISHSLIAQFK